MPFRRIMVPYDGSKQSERAFKKALLIAKKDGSSIDLVTCLQAVQKIWFVNIGYDKSVLQKHKDAAKSNMSRLELDAKKNGVKARATIIVAQSAVNPLLSFARKHSADLIVMGSHGRTGLNKLFLGSVANGILGGADCPVLIVK